MTFVRTFKTLNDRFCKFSKIDKFTFLETAQGKNGENSFSVDSSELRSEQVIKGVPNVPFCS